MKTKTKPPTDAAIRRAWREIAPDSFVVARDGAALKLAWSFFRAGMMASARPTAPAARLDLQELLYNARAQFRKIDDQVNRRVGRVPKDFKGGAR